MSLKKLSMQIPTNSDAPDGTTLMDMKQWSTCFVPVLMHIKFHREFINEKMILQELLTSKIIQ
jgi:hypothetical protein